MTYAQGPKYEHVLSLVESKNPPASISPGDECETDYGDLATHVFNSTGDLTYSDTELYDNDSKITGRLNLVEYAILDSINGTIITVGAFIVRTDDLFNFATRVSCVRLNVYSYRHYLALQEYLVPIVWTRSDQDVKNLN